MATKASEDPMDLGGFMQNFVLSNPFKDLPGIPNNKDLSETEEEEPSSTSNAVPVTAPIGGQNSSSSSPGSSHSPKSKEDLVVADENGVVLDTPKAHVGSNVVFAAALKLQKVSCAHAKVQKWLRSNFIHESTYPMCKDAKELSAEVQEHFPHITNMTLSKIMTFTFPYCVKVTNISGFHGYKGLLGKPQPEDYCNLDLLKAVSHCKLYGSIAEAAQLYDVPVASVASLHFWHPDLANLPVHMSIAEQLNQTDSSFTLPGSVSQQFRSHGTRRSKRRSLPVDYCDPDNLTDMEDDLSPRSHDKNKSPPSLSENKLLMNLKEEVETLDGADAAMGTVDQISDENHAAYSLLRNLLKRPRLDVQDSIGEGDTAGKYTDPDSSANELVVKSEPMDAGYGDAESFTEATASKDKSKSSKSDSVQRKRKLSTEKAKISSDRSDSSEVSRLRAEVQRLKSRISSQVVKNQKQEVQLLLSKKEVLSLKSALCTHQVTFTELSQDFSNVQEQFCTLQRRFHQALEQLEKDKDKALSSKRKSNQSSEFNGSAS